MKLFDPVKVPLTGTNLIEASAGTGKTYTIASLFLRLVVEKQLSPDRILVVTFTKSATEELKDRVRTKLHQAGSAFTKGKSSDKYTADQIVVLEGLEPVRKRPAMYIGSTSLVGVHHCITEIIDNSVDEALAGFAKNVWIIIHQDDSPAPKARAEAGCSAAGRELPQDQQQYHRRTDLSSPAL